RRGGGPGERAPATPAPRGAEGGSVSQRAEARVRALQGPSPVIASATAAFPIRARTWSPRRRGSRARASTAANSSRKAVTMSTGPSVPGIAVVPEPRDRARERVLDGRLPEPRLADRLAAVEEHPLARHPGSPERDPRRASGPARSESVRSGGGERDPVRELPLRRGKAGQRRQRVEDLLQAHVAVPENVLLA